jgi:tetratricopeptide (TPR) repeat protein
MGLQGISVQARASSTSFRGQNADPRTIARTLGVEVLINGTVRKRGDNLEVLIEVLDDKGFAIRQPLTFERAEQDLQALQQQIASEVGAVLVPAARASLATPAPVATSQGERANMLVLFGNHYDHEVRDDLIFDEKKADKAIDYFRSATMTDPKSIAAQTRLASALLYKGDVEAARKPLSIALDLAESTGSSLAAAELSDVYHTSAEYLQRTAAPAHEVEEAFKRALALNPSNADALGAYALWLMPRPGSPQAADPLFREAKRLDRQTILRYSDYAEYLGTTDDIDTLHELAAEIAARFPNARGYRALARLYELSGEIDVGIAWGIKALQAEPEDHETRWQVGELFSRIGDFVGAAKYDPEPAMNQLWLQRRYNELVDLGQDYVIDHPDEIKAKYLLAFGYNAIEDFTSAKYLLENMGLPPPPGTDPVRDGNTDTQYPQFLASYVDALQSLGGNDSLAMDLARYLLSMGHSGDWDVYAKGWWGGANFACAKSQLGQYADALDALDNVVAAHGLIWSPLLQDSPCFKRLAAEPRYKAVVDRVENRKRQLRERLPATLREQGVAEVTLPNRAAR